MWGPRRNGSRRRLSDWHRRGHFRKWAGADEDGGGLMWLLAMRDVISDADMMAEAAAARDWPLL